MGENSLWDNGMTPNGFDANDVNVKVGQGAGNSQDGGGSGGFFDGAFKDGESTMNTLGNVGSLINGIGSLYDAMMQRKYQKKMLDFAKQDRAEKKQRSDEATAAVGQAFKDVFKK